MESYKKFTAKNIKVDRFLSLLGRVNDVDECIVFEFDSNNNILFQSALDSRGAVKYDSVESSEIFESDGDLPELVFPIENSKRLVSALNMFSSDAENTITVNYLPVNDRLVVNDFTISQGNQLSISFNCAEFSGILYLDSETRESLFDTSETDIEFDINSDTITKMNKLFGLDSTNRFVTVKSDSDQVLLEGESYEYAISNLYEGDEFKTQFDKEYFGFIENEYSMVYVLDNRVVIKSLDSNSITVIGVSK